MRCWGTVPNAIRKWIQSKRTQSRWADEIAMPNALTWQRVAWGLQHGSLLSIRSVNIFVVKTKCNEMKRNKRRNINRPISVAYKLFSAFRFQPLELRGKFNICVLFAYSDPKRIRNNGCANSRLRATLHPSFSAVRIWSPAHATHTHMHFIMLAPRTRIQNAIVSGKTLSPKYAVEMYTSLLSFWR